MKTKFLIPITGLVFVIVAAQGCSKKFNYDIDPDVDDPHRAEIVQISKNVSLSKEDVCGIAGDKSLCDRIKYGVDCFKVTYKTLYENKVVLTDALLIVPQYSESDTPRYAAYFHGTIVPFPFKTFETAIPSNFSGKTDSKDMMYCAMPLAGSGFCVAIPDYTGLGRTGDVDHPFVCYPELYKSALDGVKACRKALIDSLDVGIDNKKIWLTGWSQGAGMSLYFQKKIEAAKLGSQFTIMANSTLAGPFSMEHFISDMMSNPDKVYLIMALYSWATYSLNRFSNGLHRPLDQIFRLDIYDQKSAILVLSTPGELYQDFFLKNIKNGNDAAFIQAMSASSTSSGWTPVAPVYMHHGKEDILVPYFNMEDAYNGLKHSGSVFTYTDEKGGHDTFVPRYMSHTIDIFNGGDPSDW